MSPGHGAGVRGYPASPTAAPEAPFCGATGASRPGATLTDVILTIPLLLAMIGLALLFGRRSSPWLVAIMFWVIGLYMRDTWLGEQITDGLNVMARTIG